MTRYRKRLNVADPEGQWPNTILEYQFVKEPDGISADRTYLHAKSTVKINKNTVFYSICQATLGQQPLAAMLDITDANRNTPDKQISKASEGVTLKLNQTPVWLHGIRPGIR